jgi:hypothetical protein
VSERHLGRGSRPIPGVWTAGVSHKAPLWNSANMVGGPSLTLFSVTSALLGDLPVHLLPGVWVPASDQARRHAFDCGDDEWRRLSRAQLLLAQLVVAAI